MVNISLTLIAASLFTVVKAGGLLDPRTGNVRSPAAVLVETWKNGEVIRNDFAAR
jgi:hypothetical protein